MEEELEKLEQRITQIRSALDAKKEKEAQFAAKLAKELKGYIQLNVGGVLYTTSRATLARYPESMLDSLVSGRFAMPCLPDGSVFIDRDGSLFGLLLNAMRTGALTFPTGFTEFEALAREVEFYQLPFQVPRARGPVAFADLSRPQLCKCLVTNAIRTQELSGLRFCGIDLRGLRFGEVEGGFTSRFIGCDFSGCDLSGTFFKNVNLSSSLFHTAEMREASFDGCLMSGADFENASLVLAKLIRCTLQRASFVKADLTDATLTFSNLDGAKLVKTNIHRANFTSASLAGANLQDTDTKTANWTDTKGVAVPK